MLRRPFITNNQVPGNLFGVLIEAGEKLQQVSAHLAEKSADYHVELFKHGAFFPFAKQVMDNQRYKQHLYKDECNIAQEVDENMMAVSENHEVQGIEKDRQQNQKQAEKNTLSQVALFHRYSCQFP
jgi:hypothetical protein